ncbi:MAG: thiol peroxidase [Parachlamydiales bacterium]|jgi:thiol peroxidase
MSQVTLRGKPIHTLGHLPSVGKTVPNFTLVGSDLSEVTLSQFNGKTVLLNIFPSLDTDVCALSVQKFNAELAKHPEITVLHISKDLPFAMNRFCSTNKLEGATTLSAFNSNFGKDFGVEIQEGPMRGLLSRAVIILDEQGKVIYEEQVPEIGQEPDYKKALSALGIDLAVSKGGNHA